MRGGASPSSRLGRAPQRRAKRGWGAGGAVGRPLLPSATPRAHRADGRAQVSERSREPGRRPGVKAQWDRPKETKPNIIPESHMRQRKRRAFAIDRGIAITHPAPPTAHGFAGDAAPGRAAVRRRPPCPKRGGGGPHELASLNPRVLSSPPYAYQHSDRMSAARRPPGRGTARSGPPVMCVCCFARPPSMQNYAKKLEQGWKT